MERDPLAAVVDAPLFIVPRVLDGLRAYRNSACLADELVQLADTLLAGIEAHPTKFWVLKQFQKTLAALGDNDAQAREYMCGELEKLMAILGIASSDGVLGVHHR
jgi:hypothetical protein